LFVTRETRERGEVYCGGGGGVLGGVARPREMRKIREISVKKSYLRREGRVGQEGALGEKLTSESGKAKKKTE